ncbi:MAG: hypothetical protein K2Q26_14805 [Bdellovibrionales bacterium]|nr:hypothetical protein [Bdellovibrionales bacterium]
MLRISMILGFFLLSLNTAASDGVGLVLINALSQTSEGGPIDFYCSNYKKETVFSVMISARHKSVDVYQAKKGHTGSCHRIDTKTFFSRYPKANAYIEQAWQIISSKSENSNYSFEVLFNNARTIDAQGHLTRLQDFLSTAAQAKTPGKPSVVLVVKGVGDNNGFYEAIPLE